MRDRGYIEGRDIAIEWRYADAQFSRAVELAGELVRLQGDVIGAYHTPAVARESLQFLALQRNDEPLPEDEDSMHEAIQQYLQERGLNFIAKNGLRRNREIECRPGALL